MLSSDVPLLPMLTCICCNLQSSVCCSCDFEMYSEQSKIHTTQLEAPNTAAYTAVIQLNKFSPWTQFSWTSNRKHACLCQGCIWSKAWLADTAVLKRLGTTVLKDQLPPTKDNAIKPHAGYRAAGHYQFLGMSGGFSPEKHFQSLSPQNATTKEIS